MSRACVSSRDKGKEFDRVSELRKRQQGSGKVGKNKRKKEKTRNEERKDSEATGKKLFSLISGVLYDDQRQKYSVLLG